MGIFIFIRRITAASRLAAERALWPVPLKRFTLGSLWNIQIRTLPKIPCNDFLCTKASYANFILRLKIKLTGDPKTGFINSGVQIRTHRNPTGHEVCGYQCDYAEPDWYGGIYDEGRRDRLLVKTDIVTLRPALKLSDWNDYVIKAEGHSIQTWINGVQGVDYEEKEAEIAGEGVIGIQVHGGGNTIVQVKDVLIEELAPTPGAVTWEKLGGVEGQRAKLKQQTPTANEARKTDGLLEADVVSIKPLAADGKPDRTSPDRGATASIISSKTSSIPTPWSGTISNSTCSPRKTARSSPA